MRDIHPTSGPREAGRPANDQTERALLRALAASKADVASGRVVPMAETFRKARKKLEDMRTAGKIRQTRILYIQRAVRGVPGPRDLHTKGEEALSGFLPMPF